MSNEKPTNPKDAVGIQKPYASCVPRPFVWGVGMAMLEGALKYGRHNYRAAGVRVSVYYDACQRHLDNFWEGLDIDPDSQLHELLKAGACLAVLYDSLVLQKNATDDRPPKSPAGWLEALKPEVEALFAKYPEPKESFTAAPTVCEPARILARDLKPAHKGLRFRVVTIQAPYGSVPTPEIGKVHAFRSGPDNDGDYCVRTEDDHYRWLGPESVLEFVE